MSDINEFGPCGKHPRKIAETPAQAWYRATESVNADKDYSQHCPECDRAATQRAPVTPPNALVLKWSAEVEAAGLVTNGWTAGWCDGLTKCAQELAAAAPVTTPGRDELSETQIKKLINDISNAAALFSMEYHEAHARDTYLDYGLDSRIEPIVRAALAAAKEPRG